jgi:GT2 family glycosyltransferase
MSGAWSSNDWPQQWVEREADPEVWRLRMSVIIPAFGRPRQLDVLLESLTKQTYPGDLTEIVIVDDGSPTPLVPRIPAGAEVIVLRQERDGFGLARARNLGARSATGDVLVFLDADMIPETTWLEAHARPHHHHSPLAGVGPRTHVSRLEVGMDEVRSDVPIQELLAVSDPERPQWILDRWATTDDGRIGDDIWWGMSGGNFSVGRQLFVDVGGYDEDGFKEWGGEDNDLGYRIYQSGAFVVPVHEAMAWHLGPATNDSADIDERRRRIKIRLASRVASDVLPRTPGMTLKIPDIAVQILAPVASFERGVHQIGEILSDSGTAAIRVSLRTEDESEQILLADYLRSEPRVVLGAHETKMGFAPIVVHWDAANWPRGLGGWLFENVGENRSAMVRIHGGLGTANAWCTRVLRQVEAGMFEESAAYDRFGGRTLTWDEVVDQITTMATAELEELQCRVTAADAKLAEMSNRRAVRLANSLGSLVRARSWYEVRKALASLTSTSKSKA